MIKFLLNFLILFIATSTYAQVMVSGEVKDTKGNILRGATITLKETYDGAITDSLGRFSFKTFEKGKFIVEVKMIDYTSVSQEINIEKDNLNLSFSLKEELNELKAITITAGSFEASDRKRAATVLSSLDIVTTANANADITGAVKTLPGAQQVGEQEGLFVRGGAGYETKQFMDGTYINNPFFTGAQDIATRGRFSPFLFKGTVFSTGGYSALYGQALSSALILESIDLPERSEASASVSSVFVGAGLQNLSTDKKSSYGFNYGYTNLLPYFKIVKQTPDYFAVPAFHNLDGNFRIKTKKGMIKFYSQYNSGDLGLRRPNIDDANLKNAFGVTNSNWYNNISWKEFLGNGWRINVAGSYSTNKDHLTQEIQNQNNTKTTTGLSYIDNNNFIIDQTQNVSQLRTVVEKKLGGISYLRFGGEYWHSYVKSKYNNLATSLNDNLFAGFAESDIYISNSFVAKVGARVEHSSIINKWNVAPRISLAYKVGKEGSMSFAYGDFYQKPENIYLFNTKNFKYTKATHYILNYSKMTQFYSFRIEGFYKKYTDLVKTYPTYNNAGTGYAQGIELFWRDKKTFKNVDYWLSYSYLDTKRDFNNFPMQLQPTFAANHTASLVVKRFVTEWKTGFNFTYSYATGRPYYNFQNNGNSFTIKDEGRTIPFNSLSFSLNYLPNIGKKDAKTFIVLVASMTNVLNQTQVFGYNYSYDGNTKQAINPPAQQFFFLGCFLSWGVDRTQNAINNNL
ncbi:MAG: TonB-dependent receptor [Chitinophagaceae bacterium]|nr:TonB-dependent receptor [Chitinophagaceae bacterium]